MTCATEVIFTNFHINCFKLTSSYFPWAHLNITYKDITQSAGTAAPISEFNQDGSVF